MRDLFFLTFLAAIFCLGLRRPFLLVLVYAYIDIVSPQRLSYYLLNSVPVSAIAFALAAGAWLLVDRKGDSRFSARQGLMVALLALCAWTTAHADFPVEAATKWNWVWKAMVFAIFLPLTLRTRLRIEALALVMVLCASSIIITGGIKTALSGGGYGVLNLMIDDNSGLYEGSTISTVAIAIIPLVWWLARYGTIFPPDWRVRLFAGGLCFACLLIPIGTETRTGLLCIILLAGLMLLHMKRRIAYGALIAVGVLVAIPFLPASFTSRMNTIEGYQGDESASTRLAVWRWTWDYAKEHPLGGGFDAYRGNSFTYQSVRMLGKGAMMETERQTIVDKGRAYHSAYFEMLGEQGYAGFLLWALIHGISLVRTEGIRRRYRRQDGPDTAWIAPLALALQQGHLIYLLGALFIGIAYQPFVFMLLALQIGLDTYLARLRKAGDAAPIFASPTTQARAA
ncbi:MAG: putative O-glycosylation ligase, exosortase A system-associated [Sphingobium sp.]|nr:MAG: putative O-glycosylation ligase, exosortase A system-associated [Sphingobium sp.]